MSGIRQQKKIIVQQTKTTSYGYLLALRVWEKKLFLCSIFDKGGKVGGRVFSEVTFWNSAEYGILYGIDFISRNSA